MGVLCKPAEIFTYTIFDVAYGEVLRIAEHVEYELRILFQLITSVRANRLAKAAVDDECTLGGHL